MTAEIINVGTELLLGQIANANAQHLARALARLGFDVLFHTVVGDNLPRLTNVLQTALGRSDVIVTTGGLGPTEDDVTRAAVAAAAGLPLVPDADARRWHVPRGAVVIANRCGTAPGFVLEVGARAVVCLPGPPNEWNAMFSDVSAYLTEKRGPAGRIILSRSLRMCGIDEVGVEGLAVGLLRGNNPTVASYARPGEVELRITASAGTEEEARGLIRPVEAQLRERLRGYVFGADDETLETVIGGLLRATGRTLAVAESCTGGLVGHRLTNVPGSSDYFLSSLVVYANSAKGSVLGVGRETLRRHGAVSRETAMEMARGVRAVAAADIGVSITGIAGPGGATAGKPVGTVFFGLVAGDDSLWRKRVFPGDRGTVKAWAAQEALTLLWQYLVGACRPDTG